MAQYLGGSEGRTFRVGAMHPGAERVLGVAAVDGEEQESEHRHEKCRHLVRNRNTVMEHRNNSGIG